MGAATRKLSDAQARNCVKHESSAGQEADQTVLYRIRIRRPSDACRCLSQNSCPGT